MEEKDGRVSNDTTVESIKSLTDKDAKTILNLIYAVLKDNTSPKEQLISSVLSIYEKQIPRMVKARQNRNE
ncbi:hypothetical protein GCM10008915_57290 [Bifidobacterium pullorum subsp. gallinarum]